MNQINIFCPTIGVGGVEKNLYIISNYLVKKNIKINVITCDFHKKKHFNKKINFIGPQSSKYSKSFPIFKIIISIIFFLRSNSVTKSSLLFSFQSNLFAILLALITNRKVITRINASPDLYLRNSIKKFLFRFLYKYSDCIIVNSRELNKKIKFFLNLNSSIIYNPAFNKSKINIQINPKKKLKNIPKNKVIKLLNVGRLVRQKNQILLIKTMDYLKNNSDIKFKLLIIGNGILLNYLKKEIENRKLNNSVKIISNINQPYSYMVSSNFFILSSLYEGLPNVLIEALSLKKLVISSDCPTGPKEILLNGKCGYLFKNNDHISLAKVILKAINQNKINKKKILYGYRSINRFDENKNCEKYFRLLNKHLNE